jgi:hypothetical protein
MGFQDERTRSFQHEVFFSTSSLFTQNNETTQFTEIKKGGGGICISTKHLAIQIRSVQPSSVFYGYAWADRKILSGDRFLLRSIN